MKDSEIISRFWERNPDAITETAAAYGNYLQKIAQNILGSVEDAEECVNDTYHRAWNAIPPQRPQVLSAYLAGITRNLAFNRWKSSRTAGRGGGELPLVLDELAECVSGSDDAESETFSRELGEELNRFLRELPDRQRRIFLSRYWYAESVSSIASRFGMTAGNVSVILNRTRKKLRNYLTERGYAV